MEEAPMTYVPKINNPAYETTTPAVAQSSPIAITVHALKENKRPIGFAPWPKPERKQRTRRKTT
jgi:hypothetical protein